MNKFFHLWAFKKHIYPFFWSIECRNIIEKYIFIYWHQPSVNVPSLSFVIIQVNWGFQPIHTRPELLNVWQPFIAHLIFQVFQHRCIESPELKTICILFVVFFYFVLHNETEWKRQSERDKERETKTKAVCWHLSTSTVSNVTMFYIVDIYYILATDHMGLHIIAETNLICVVCWFRKRFTQPSVIKVCQMLSIRWCYWKSNK